MAAVTVNVRDLQVGDEITEIDTPFGPWYTVEDVDARRQCLRIDGAEIGFDSPAAVVLKRAP